MQTTTEKIELIRYLILGEIKLCNPKNVHFRQKHSSDLEYFQKGIVSLGYHVVFSG